MTSETCSVRTNSKAYQIHIGEGLLEKAGDLLSPHLKRKWVVIVTDSNVEAALGARLRFGLDAAEIEYQRIVVDPGERSKSMSGLEYLVETLLGLGTERDDTLLAFGGGVIGDLTGFAAAILKRGCQFAQLPTTLLAQVDSAVGGKTAVNSAHGKNLIGAFHQPTIVISDTSALSTLPQRQLKAGYAEIVKYGALGDEPFFAWLEKRGLDILDGDAVARRVAVKRACETKAEIVAADEHERGIRALLNLGHTFGHALEAAHAYADTLLHGEAISVGMALAFDYSVSLGLCPRFDSDRLKSHLASIGLPTKLSEVAIGTGFNAEELVHLMLKDKKVDAGSLTLVLARRLGEAFIEKSVEPASLLAFLKSEGAQ